MSFKEHRQRLFDVLAENSLAICYAGEPVHTSEDEYYNFEENTQFFYLTGLERAGMILLMSNIGGKNQETLFIEEADPLLIRWTGKMPTREEAAEIAGMDVANVLYLPAFDSMVRTHMSRSRVENVYFDTYRLDPKDAPDYNAVKANEFISAYPSVRLFNLRDTLVPLRECKDADEIEWIKKAINITHQGLDHVLSTLKPGMIEYHVQAEFEYKCKSLGAKRWAFNTISGAGINGCMMHYVLNNAECKDGDLLLLDLGAKYNNYCSDISRTYPVNGKFTDRQRQYYDLVLKANYAVRDAAKPGMTTADLNNITKQVLAEGLMAMGKISTPEEVSRYYMHGVSHPIGIDCHDCQFTGDKLQPGWVISDEPGLYIDEECIGIRIEDDLLITEDGCVVLTQDVIREADEIEAFMAAHNK